MQHYDFTDPHGVSAAADWLAKAIGDVQEAAATFRRQAADAGLAYEDIDGFRDIEHVLASVESTAYDFAEALADEAFGDEEA